MKEERIYSKCHNLLYYCAVEGGEKNNVFTTEKTSGKATSDFWSENNVLLSRHLRSNIFTVHSYDC
jgi:hypothetical protein